MAKKNYIMELNNLAICRMSLRHANKHAYNHATNPALTRLFDEVTDDMMELADGQTETYGRFKDLDETLYALQRDPACEDAQDNAIDSIRWVMALEADFRDAVLDHGGNDVAELLDTIFILETFKRVREFADELTDYFDFDNEYHFDYDNE